MNLSAEQILENLEIHKQFIKDYIQGPRQQQCLDLIDELGENYAIAPASSKTWYHNAFPGGYVAHVNNVINVALHQKQFYESIGGNIDFTDEELVFAALFHDLGKIGDGEKPNYLPQTDNWRKEKLQEQYTNNPDLQYMLIPDRSLFVLQSKGIRVSEKEFLGIRLHDGVFDEANKSYFFNYVETSKLKTNIVYILHVADFLASKMEYDVAKSNTVAKPKLVLEKKANNFQQAKAKAMPKMETGGLKSVMDNFFD